MTANPDHTSRWARHRPVLQFLAKAAAIYGLWYVLYDLWLLPDGRLDACVSQTAAHVTGVVLSGVGLDAAVEGRTVQIAHTSGVRIINGCNGLATIGAFIGFIVAYPGKTKRRLWFIPLGIAIIFLANVARVSVLAGSQAYWPAAFSWLHGCPRVPRFISRSLASGSYGPGVAVLLWPLPPRTQDLAPFPLRSLPTCSSWLKTRTLLISDASFPSSPRGPFSSVYS